MSRADLSDCIDEHLLLGFVLGERLADDTRRQILEHIDGCVACRTVAAELARDDDVSRDRSTADFEGPPSDRLPFEQGSVIAGRYVIVEPIGYGAMGTVYRASDRETSSDVALKVLREGALERGADARAFAREVTVGRRVSHPNVCRLFDAGQYDGRPTSRWSSSRDRLSPTSSGRAAEITSRSTTSSRSCRGSRPGSLPSMPKGSFIAT